MDNHIMETLVIVGTLATVGSNLLNFLEVARQFKRMNARGNKILARLGEIIEELKE